MLAASRREVLHEAQRQRQDVFAAGAQRRYGDRENMEPVIQVFAEPSCRDLVAERAVGHGDHAHVYADLARSAQAPERTLFEEAKQLGLQCQGNPGDLVEDDRTAIGELEQSLAGGLGVSESPLLVSEKLTLNEPHEVGGGVAHHQGA